MHLSITQINTDRGYRFNEYNIPIEEGQTKKEVFNQLMEEFGRPISKVYMGQSNPVAIGWVFVKRVPYSDCDESYLQETWAVVERWKQPIVEAIPLKQFK